MQKWVPDCKRLHGIMFPEIPLDPQGGSASAVPSVYLASRSTRCTMDYATLMEMRFTALQVVEECQQLTQDTIMSHFGFSVPLVSPVSFATPLMSLRWVLRFDFAVQLRPAGGRWPLSGSAPRQSQKITWLLPVLVRAPGA